MLQFSATLVPNEVKPGVSVAMVTGTLSNRDNKFTLKVGGVGNAA